MDGAPLGTLEANATIARVWEALGITTYEEAGGKNISELVAEKVAEVERLKALVADLVLRGVAAEKSEEDHLSAMTRDPHYWRDRDPEWRRSEWCATGTPEEAAGQHLSAMMRDPRYWRDRDPGLIEAVAETVRRLYPDSRQASEGKAEHPIESRLPDRALSKPALDDIPAAGNSAVASPAQDGGGDAMPRARNVRELTGGWADTFVNDLIAERAALHQTARLLFTSYHAWDRARLAGTCHGSSERDRFETNLDTLMEDLGITGKEMRVLMGTEPGEVAKGASHG